MAAVSRAGVSPAPLWYTPEKSPMYDMEFSILSEAVYAINTYSALHVARKIYEITGKAERDALLQDYEDGFGNNTPTAVFAVPGNQDAAYKASCRM